MRNITGAYQGSSHERLGWIANAEPLQAKLDDISRAWAAQSLRTGDPHICKLLDKSPMPAYSPWHDGGIPHCPRDSPISDAFYLTAIEPQERSYEDREETSTTPLIDLTIMDPAEERTKTTAFWVVGL